MACYFFKVTKLDLAILSLSNLQVVRVGSRLKKETSIKKIDKEKNFQN